ncbi:MAG: hypothetical protein NVSMB25_16540 [Thermoleophilaceae bacterium]
MSTPVRPPASAEKSLGDIVGEITQKASLLVREEIALAKTEVTQKVSRLGRGAVFLAIAGVLLIYFSIFLFIALALGLNELLTLKPWVGFAIVTLFFLVLTAVLALLGIRRIKKGTPPTPALAIEEARKTRAALGEVRG